MQAWTKVTSGRLLIVPARQYDVSYKQEAYVMRSFGYALTMVGYQEQQLIALLDMVDDAVLRNEKGAVIGYMMHRTYVNMNKYVCYVLKRWAMRTRHEKTNGSNKYTKLKEDAEFNPESVTIGQAMKLSWDDQIV